MTTDYSTSIILYMYLPARLVVRGRFLFELCGNVIIARIGLVLIDRVAVLTRIVPRVFLVVIGLREDTAIAVEAETLHATQYLTREGLTGLDVLVGPCFEVTLA